MSHVCIYIYIYTHTHTYVYMFVYQGRPAASVAGPRGGHAVRPRGNNTTQMNRRTT